MSWKTAAFVGIVLLVAGSLAAEPINARETFRPGSVDELHISDSRSTFGIVMRNNIDMTITVVQGGSGDIEVALTGDVDTNQRRCLPELSASQSRGVAEVEVELCSGPALFLSLSGAVSLNVRVPRNWQGELDVRASSATVEIGDAVLESLDVRVSSGLIDLGAITADSVDLESSSGLVRADGIEAESVTVESSSGGADIERLFADEISLDSSSGGIAVREASGAFDADLSSGRLTIDFRGRPGSVTAESSSGGIEVRGIDGSVDLDASSGSILAEFVRLRDDSYIEASSGDVRAVLPRDADFQLDLDASSGRITVDFPVTVEGRMNDDEVEGRVGAGGPMLEIDTASGDIAIVEG